MIAARLDGCAVVVRELMPQDLKFDAEHLSELDAVKAAHFLALVVGQAHAGQMDAATRKAWLTELRISAPASSGAPLWLWRSIVELLVTHEAQYLEHCRRYALESQANGNTPSRHEFSVASSCFSSFPEKPPAAVRYGGRIRHSGAITTDYPRKSIISLEHRILAAARHSCESVPALPTA